ncbi:Stp1/IreP family PP2C-type Ser/Thr phosphatase [Oscillospiraceae bacterium MB08-C2-2]|nr:Stp1/IreP family PP2C-type Ser/Thr phosphatase [Oscillospiraceae bacterium MB08-C2-2]
MINIWGGTHTGRVRKANQDKYDFKILGKALAFMVVCDGMGGENGGSVASSIAVSCISEMLTRDLPGAEGEQSVLSIMRSAIAGANALVFEAASKDEGLSGMGTTLVLGVVWNSSLFIGYVGDSRVYRVSGEAETQITRDHTVVQMLLDIGEISKEQVENHPQRHYITRAVGVSESVDADFVECPLEEGDMVLICSDGLYHYVEQGGFVPLLRECVRQKSVDSLIRLANEQGGADNITAVVLQVAAQ